MKSGSGSKKGFALAEVVIAFAVISFCLTVILGLFAVGINTDRGTIGQNAAESEAREVYYDLVNTASQSGAVSSFGITLPAAPTGTATTTSVITTIFFSDDGRHTSAGQPISSISGTTAKFRMTVIMSRPSPPVATSVRLWVTWPAEADPNPAVLPSHFSGSYEVLTALNQY